MSPSSAGQRAVEAAHTLRETLTTLAESLATGSLAGVLEAEPALASALAATTALESGLSFNDLSPEETGALRAELDAARAALTRSEALGAALRDFARGRGFATTTYDATGTGILERARSAIDERV